MRVLKNLLLLLLFAFQVVHVYAQKNTENAEQLIAEYEKTKDSSLLWRIYFQKDKSYDLVINWMEKSSKIFPDINYFVGMLLDDKGQTQKAIAYYEAAWRNGDIYGARRLGQIYFEGEGGIVKNKKTGCDWLKIFVDKKPNNSAATDYGICLDSNFDVIPGFNQSLEQACNWYKLGALEYFKDYESTLKWNIGKFQHGRAYVLYALCLDDKSYKSLDIKSSSLWLQRSAKMEHPYGLYLYGTNLIEGRGVVQSFTEGIKYLTKAAELGSNVAQNSLGVIYAEGRVSPKNLAEAYKWFVIASANGYENAQSNKGNAEKQLTPNEVKSIQIKAKQWQDKYLKSND